jgi:amino acid adenylation domain-containing protein
MSAWQNPEQDLGYPLSRQQQRLVDNGTNTLRSYWFEFPLSYTVDQLAQKLLVLMEQHQALSTYFGKPAHFDVIRQQVQTPRLNVSEFEYVNHSVLPKAERQILETKAHAAFTQSQPHLLFWGWRLNNTLTVQLVAPSLMVDHDSVYSVYTQLMHGVNKHETMQYPEYIEWLNELQNDDDAQLGQHYWQSLSLFELPDARLSEQRQASVSSDVNTLKDKNHGSISILLSESRQTQLKAVAEKLECTGSDIVVNIWAMLLSKLTSYDELKLDYYHDCRHDYEEFTGAMGLFVQSLPMPFYQLSQADLAGSCQGFSQLFEEMKENQEYVSTLDEILSTSCHAGYYWHKQSKREDMYCNDAIADNELLLHYIETAQRDGKFTLFYNNSRYEHDAMKRALDHFYILLVRMLDAPYEKSSQLTPLLSDEITGEIVDNFIAQRSSLALDKLDNNSISDEQFDQIDIVTLFKIQAQTYPNNVAIQSNHNNLTYQELDKVTDCYARAFQEMGAKPDAIIALCLPRDIDFLITLLAVLKSGAAYLPLDPEQPTARLQQIINDAQPIILITELTQLAATQCCSLNQLNQLNQNQQPFVPAKISPHHLAYVLYTSGSTGLPKGVQVEHQQISHYSQSVIFQLDMPSQSHYGLISSLMADLGNTMLFPAWLTGSCLHLLGEDETNDGRALAEYMHIHPLDCLKIVPSHLEALLASGTNILPKKVLVLGGEMIQTSLIKHLRDSSPMCRIFNHYGPTETTVGVLIGKVNLKTGQSRLSATIGYNHISLLDENRQPVISGQCAELYVSGPNVTRGYLNDANQTEAVYLSVATPSNNPPRHSPSHLSRHNRQYKTGDLALCHADGSISILGRNDQQIKIRGFRLDLNEIQHLLLGQENITQATLQTRGHGENTQLLAFVILAKGQEFSEAKLLHYLSLHLPNYMIPTHIYAVIQFPLNKNGKINKRQLFNIIKAQQQAVIAPKNDLEQQLLIIWQEVLQQKSICVTANFFDSGGHSLAAIKVVAKIRNHLSIELPTDLLFQYKSITEISNYITTCHQSSSIPSMKIDRLIPLNEQAKKNKIANNTPTLVLMHSLTGHFNYHITLIKNIGNEQPLFGLTPNNALISKSETLDSNMLSDDYIEQLLPLKDKPLTLVGWSLGGKQMMLMVKRMLSLGFKVNSVALIDYDPNQSLTLDDSAQQLVNDFHSCLASENLKLSNAVVDDITRSLSGNYQQAMEQLLTSSHLTSILGQEVTSKELQQRFMMRRKIKYMLYNTVMPKVDLPIWLWHGTGHKSPPQVWQQFSSLPLKSWYLQYDHYEILNQPALSKQLIENIVELNTMVVC